MGSSTSPELWLTSRYPVGSTLLFELLLRELEADLVRLPRQVWTRLRPTDQARAGVPRRRHDLRCAVGQHDDLAISLAMLAWAAQHPHLKDWMKSVEATHRPSPPCPPL